MTPTFDQLIGYTKSRISDNELTYSIRNSVVAKPIRKQIKSSMADVDSRIGLDFRFTKRRKQADVIIGKGDLPEGAAASVRWDTVRWEVRLPAYYYSDGVFRHEIGHILGLDHTSQEANSLMRPQVSAIRDFTKEDYQALRLIWGAA